MGSTKASYKALKDKPEQLIRLACVFRTKYRQGEKVRLPPVLVGVHPDNRGGAKMSGLRVLELLKLLLENGFDGEEADCGGVVIASTSMVMEFNVMACAGDPLLVATVGGKGLQFGSLSHSHLNQLLKNLCAQMAVPLEEQDDPILSPILGPFGDFQLPLLKIHDDTFEQYAREGLSWDVLDEIMQTEEPDAAQIISAAANVKNAMYLIPHEMEAIKLTSKYCSKEAAVAGSVAFTTLRDHVAQTMPSIALDPDFFHLFKFVIEVGADSYNHIGFLVDFLSKFVDPAKRRLRLTAFSVVTELPIEAAHMRVALFVHAYCQEPKEQYCDSPSRPNWKLVVTRFRPMFDSAQNLLRFFTEDKKQQLEKFTAFDRIRFLGNLYKEVAEAFKGFKPRSEDDVQKKMLGIGSKFKTRYEQMSKEECKDMPSEFASSGSGAEPAQSTQSTQRRAPIAQFDSAGKVIPVEVPVVVDLTEVTIDWKGWSKDSAGAVMMDAKMKALAYSACVQMWVGQAQAVTEHPLELVKPVLKPDQLSKTWVVRATEDIEKDQLLLVPYVATPDRLSDKKSLSPDAIVVTVQCGAIRKTFWVAPDFVARSDEDLRAKGSEKVGSRSLFWACKRSSKDDEWNCDLEDMKSSVVVCSEWNGISVEDMEPEAMTVVVTVPVLVNKRKIVKGSAVVMKCEPPKVQPVVDKKKKGRTWEDDAKSVIASDKKEAATKKNKQKHP